MRPRIRPPFLIALGVVIAFRILVLVLGIHQGHTVDIDRFYAIGHARGRPYIDYQIEYPIALVALVKLVAFATPSSPVFTAVIIIMSLLADVVIAVLLWRTWSPGACLWFLIVESALIGLFVVRLDLVTVALVVGGTAAVLRRRPVLAALLIAVAIGMKLWPIPIALILVPAMPAGTRRRYLTTLAASLGVLLAAWVTVGGITGIKEVLTFRGAVGWQIESVVGSVVHLFTREPAIQNEGAQRFGHVPPGLTIVLTLIGVAVTVWVLLRVRGRDDIGVAWVATVGTFLACSTLLSPQFISWLIPAGAMAWVAGHRATAVAVAAVALLTVVENADYGGLAGFTPAGLAFVVMRNVALVVAVVIALRALRGRRAAPQRI